MYNSGQRYPGIVVQVIQSNEHSLASPDLAHAPLVEFEVYHGDGIVLTHAPNAFIFDRFYIAGVCDYNDKQAVEKSRELLKAMNAFSILAKICFMTDSEHGPYHRIHKKKDDSIIVSF